MKKSNLFNVAIASITLATIYNINSPKEISAFTIGGSSGATSCRVMEYLNHPDNEWVEFNTASGKVTMPLFTKFNSNCQKTRSMPWAVEHINGANGKTNVFVLKRVGDIVAYTPDLGEYSYLTNGKGKMSDISYTADGERQGNVGNNRHGTSFLDYSVPANDTSCGYSPKKGEGGYQPTCIKNQTYYDWGHFLKSNTEANRNKLATAIAKNDTKTIESLTGEWEYIGYSYDGTVIPNPYFPSDWPIQYSGSGKVRNYPSVNNPWAWGTAKTEYDSAIKGETRYNIKYSAISDFKSQENMKDSVSTLMNKLSLKNDARYSAGVFEMRGDKYYDKEEGEWIRFYTLGLVNSPIDSLNNVALMELAIYDGDTKVASWTRKAAMLEAGDAFVLKDKNGKLVTLEGGKDYRVEVKVLNDSKQSLSTPHKINVEIDDAEAISISSGASTLSLDATKTLSKTITMPEANGFVNIDASLDDSVYGSANHWKIDDYAKVKVQVKTPQGDISVCDIKLFEKGGTTAIKAEDIVQDREYDVKYYICYEGDDIKGKHKVDVTGTLATTGQYHQEISLDRTIEIELSKTNVITETIRVSNPEIITNIKISTDNDKINTDTTNDSKNAEFKNAPNIKLNNLTITPGKIEFTPVGCHIVTVSYNLTLEDVKSNYDATFNTTTRIVIGNKSYEVTDKVKKGTHKYTHNLEYCFPNGDDGGTRQVIAEANKNQAMFESTINDNVDRIDWNGSNNGLDRIGCPVGDNVKNEVTWTQTYTIDTVEVWYESGRLMQKVIKSENKTVSNQTESFKITSIQMRSKLQQDLEMGEDGWIDVIRVTDNKAEQIAIPKIKAGYGFEFRIQAEYTTNAFDNVNQQIDIPTLESGKKQTIQVVSAGSHDKPNLVNEFYLNIDGKTTLNVGNGLDLDIEKSGTNNSTNTFNVTITPHTSPNTGEANDTRVYIGENTADGEYKMTFYTPVITGLTSKSESENTILCDDIEIKFKVIGSVYDDLNTHETR